MVVRVLDELPQRVSIVPLWIPLYVRRALSSEAYDAISVRKCKRDAKFGTYAAKKDM